MKIENIFKNGKLPLAALALGALTITLTLTDANAGQVVRRERRQQARIAQGVKSGELNAREAARLERGEARIENAREHALADDGKLDRKERRHLNRMENRESRRIWRQKHDAQKAPGAGAAADQPAATAPEQPAAQ